MNQVKVQKDVVWIVLFEKIFITELDHYPVTRVISNTMTVLLQKTITLSHQEIEALKSSNSSDGLISWELDFWIILKDEFLTELIQR